MDLDFTVFVCSKTQSYTDDRVTDNDKTKETTVVRLIVRFIRVIDNWHIWEVKGEWEKQIVTFNVVFDRV